MSRRVKRLEAALYSAGRPLAVEEILPVLGTKSDRIAAKVVHVLHHKYRLRDCALEVVILEDGRVEMKLKPSYEEMVQQVNKKPLLKLGPLKTLSYIGPELHDHHDLVLWGLFRFQSSSGEEQDTAKADIQRT
jgi:segregation and condensation protein B